MLAMSLRLTDLTRRVHHRSAITPPARAANLRVEPLEDRAVPSAIVTVEKIADAD
jgi:hypothetical protein